MLKSRIILQFFLHTADAVIGKQKSDDNDGQMRTSKNLPHP